MSITATVVTVNQLSNNEVTFKTPLVPLRRGRSTKISRQDVISNRTNNISVDNVKPKPVNKRKIFKRTHIPNNHLLVTPAQNMINRMWKRSFESDGTEDENAPKRRKMKDEPFHFEIIQYNDCNNQNVAEIVSEKLKTIKVEDEMSDQNENLLPQSNCCDQIDEYVSESIKLEIDDLKIPLITPKTEYQIIEFLESNLVDEKIDNKFDVFNCAPLIIQQYNIDPSSLTHQPDDSSIYTGKLLWCRYMKYPYWPSIVCPSITGIIQDEDHQVHVRFFANKGTSGWIKIKDTFNFNGMESFMAKKMEVQSSITGRTMKNWFHLAFDTKKYKSWTSALLEATFIMNKNLNLRLSYFDILVQMSFNGHSKQTNISEWKSVFSTDKLINTNILLVDNPSIIKDITDEMNQLASTLAIEDSIVRKEKNKHKRSYKRSHSSDNIIKRRSAVESTESKKVNTDARRSLRTLTTHSSYTLYDEPKLFVRKPVTVEDSKNNKIKRQLEKSEMFEKDLTTYIVKTYPKNMLFKNVPRGNVCKICFSIENDLTGELVKCSGTCGSYVHFRCMTATNSDTRDKVYKRKSDSKVKNLICNECIDGTIPICYSCRKVEQNGKLVKCHLKICNRYYHINCLNDWLQTKFIESDKVLCPLHVCHTCMSDNPQNKHYSTSDSKLTHCIKCPTTFHIDSNCIPAGTKILTQSQHICIRHRGQYRKPVNVSWCYICGKNGGAVLCCESCPHSSHLSCLKLPAAPDRYICDGCETGRHPLYGEIVWAKFSHYRWWPAVIVPSFCIPQSIEIIAHHEHDLCVRFFGTYEFVWIGRNFVYLYNEGDANVSITGKSNFDIAVVQAENWFNKNKPIENGNTVEMHNDKLLPKPFLRISVIKPLKPARLTKGESEFQQCKCAPTDIDPCGPKSSCVNRACLIECDARLCPCGDKCRNQCIEKRIYAKVKLAYMGEKGFGLLADKFICAGSLIIEYVGELITEDQYQQRRNAQQKQHFYFMKYMKGLYIDAEFKGNMSRFINHSCNPNCEPQVWSVNGTNRIGLFALTDILEGTELTFNYEFDDYTQLCYCGDKGCKGFIGKKTT